jgi:hypothetical protein
VNDEFERMWKKSALALCYVLSQNLPVGTEENHEEPQTGQPVYGPRLESGTSRIRSRIVNHSTTTFGDSRLERPISMFYVALNSSTILTSWTAILLHKVLFPHCHFPEVIFSSSISLLPYFLITSSASVSFPFLHCMPSLRLHCFFGPASAKVSVSSTLYCYLDEMWAFPQRQLLPTLNYY